MYRARRNARRQEATAPAKHGNPFARLVQSSANIPYFPLLPPKPPGCWGPRTPEGFVDLTTSTAQQDSMLQHDPVPNGTNLFVRPLYVRVYGHADLIWAVLIPLGHSLGHGGRIQPVGAVGGMHPSAQRRQGWGAELLYLV